jgi:hypothetical protein
LTDAAGRPALSVPAGNKLRLFTAQRFLVELVPAGDREGYSLRTRAQHMGGDSSACGLFFGHREILRGNRTEHWYWTFRFAEIGPEKGTAFLTAYYYHEPGAQPTRWILPLKGWRLPVAADAHPPGWHDLELRVTSDGVAVSFDGAPLWTKTHSELADAAALKFPPLMPKVISEALVPAFPSPREAPRLDGWGGLGLYLERGEASFCNTVIRPLPGSGKESE